MNGTMWFDLLDHAFLKYYASEEVFKSKHSSEF